MAANPLTSSQSEEIRVGIDHDDTISTIAKELEGAKSTISREIFRNGGKGAFRAHAAEERCVGERACEKETLFKSTPALAEHVTRCLRSKDSPMTIAEELKRGLFPDISITVSHETIYTAIYANGQRGLAKGFRVNLHLKYRCRKHRQAKGIAETRKLGPLDGYAKIVERPREATERTGSATSKATSSPVTTTAPLSQPCSTAPLARSGLLGSQKATELK